VKGIIPILGIIPLNRIFTTIMLIKICGIQSVEDAKTVIDAGAHFIGLNFVRSSKRRISVHTAHEIVRHIRYLSPKVQIVGVFQNQTPEYINMIADQISLDLVQLHGGESPKFVSNISKPVIKAFSLDSKFDVAQTVQSMKAYNVAHYLIDRKAQGRGEVLSSHQVAQLAHYVDFFLAGGLTPENVKGIVATTKPYAVDVAGGVEVDGRIDEKKVKEFVTSCYSE